ncbi:MAG: glycosyltransferase family 1 protein [Terracidiphilus sp.]
MKILIAAASFPSQISGVQRQALSMARCLLRHPEVTTLHVVVAPWQRGLADAAGIQPDPRLCMHVAEMNRGSLSRNLWYYRRLPELAARLDVDLVHLSYPVPVNSARFSCPVLVTLLDLYPYEIPRNFGYRKVLFNRVILQQCLRGVDSIVCISDATRNLLQNYVPASVWRKSTRIYISVEPPKLCGLRSPIPGLRGEPFLLSVAQHRLNKNICLLIESFNRLLRLGKVDPRMKLLIVGIAGPETRRIHRLISRLNLGQNIHLLEGLTEPELQWCYAQSEVVVAPSRTEGFGLPVVEALLAGSRVVCSDIPAFREVGGQHCRFVNLKRNAQQILAEAIEAAMREPAKAPVSFPQFSPTVLAEQYVALYRGLIPSAPLRQSATISTSLQIATPERRSL